VVFFATARRDAGWFGGYGFSGTMGFFTHKRIPAPLAFLAIAAEFFGGIGLVVGFLSRGAFGHRRELWWLPVLTVHLPFGLFMNWSARPEGRGIRIPPSAIALGIAIAVRGAGALPMDRALSRTKPE